MVQEDDALVAICKSNKVLPTPDGNIIGRRTVILGCERGHDSEQSGDTTVCELSLNGLNLKIRMKTSFTPCIVPNRTYTWFIEKVILNRLVVDLKAPLRFPYHLRSFNVANSNDPPRRRFQNDSDYGNGVCMSNGGQVVRGSLEKPMFSVSKLKSYEELAQVIYDIFQCACSLLIHCR